MPTAKPTKPSITIPSAFGTSQSNIKTAYTPQELIDGYSASIQQVYDGGNLNWSLDAFFQYHNYTTAIADWLNGLPANSVPFINSSNQLDSATPVFADADNTFTGNNSFSESIVGTTTGNLKTDGSNPTQSGKTAILSWAFPGSRSEEITVGASGASYQAPANGWFVFTTKNNPAVNNYTYLNNTTSNVSSYAMANANIASAGFVPVKSGDIVTLQYVNSQINKFTFVYAKGEPNV